MTGTIKMTDHMSFGMLTTCWLCLAVQQVKSIGRNSFSWVRNKYQKALIVLETAADGQKLYSVQHG